MDQTAELKVLFPTTEITLSTGESLTLAPIKFGQIPQVVKLITPIAGVLDELRKEDSNAMLLMAGDAGEDIVKLLSFVLKKERTWFDDLSADDGVEVLAKVLEVNYDFFIQKVVPTFKRTTEKLQLSRTGSSP